LSLRKSHWRRQYTDALKLLETAEAIPHNLAEGKLQGAQDNDIFYLKATVAMKHLNQPGKANEFLQKAIHWLAAEPSAGRILQ